MSVQFRQRWTVDGGRVAGATARAAEAEVAVEDVTLEGVVAVVAAEVAGAALTRGRRGGWHATSRKRVRARIYLSSASPAGAAAPPLSRVATSSGLAILAHRGAPTTSGPADRLAP